MRLFAMLLVAMLASQASYSKEFLQFTKPETSNSNWAAIASNDDGEYAFVSGGKSAEDAQHAAKMKCPGLCTNSFPVAAGYCVSVVRYQDGNLWRFLASGSAYGAYDAQKRISSVCRTRSLDCKFVASKCNEDEQ